MRNSRLEFYLDEFEALKPGADKTEQWMNLRQSGIGGSDAGS